MARFPYRMLYSAPDVDYPGTHGGSTHVGEAVRSFSHTCEHVYLLCAHTSGQPFFERQKNLTILRVWIPLLSVLRVMSYFLYPFFISFFLALVGKINLIYERARIFGGGAIVGSSLFSLPSLYEMIEPYVDIPVVLGTIRKESLLFSIIKAWHSFVVTKAEFVTITHPSFLRSVPAHKAFFVHTGVDTSTFKSALPLREIVHKYHLVKGKTLLYLGSFTEWHSCTTTIKAVSSVVKRDKNVHLLMVGDGQQRQACMNLVRELGLERNIHFIGALPFTQVPSYINTADICLALFDRNYPPFKKLDYYYSTIKIHEYKACQKPIIASNIGLLKELVVHHKHGLLVNEQNISSVSQAISTLIAKRQLRLAMGKRARKDVMTAYTWDIINTKILKELERRRAL